MTWLETEVKKCDSLCNLVIISSISSWTTEKEVEKEEVAVERVAERVLILVEFCVDD
jgi:hypothetical protein